MGVNIRTKGAIAEREIVTALNCVLSQLHENRPFPTVQRNQQQTAVGGADLINTFDLVIEVKRQEVLSVNTWWAQAVASASNIQGGIPVLLYRQSNKKWQAVMFVQMPQSKKFVRATLDWVDFLDWFRHYANMKLRQ